MDALAWTIVGLAATIALGIATLLVNRRYGTRRGRLLLTWEVAPLLRHSMLDPDTLVVTYRDHPVSDPHLILLAVTNVGPIDVPTARFDEKEPLVIRLEGSTFYGLLRTNSAARTWVPEIGGDSEVRLLPGLMKRGEEWAATVLVSGEPVLSINNPLVDVDIVEKSRAEEMATLVTSEIIQILPLPMQIGARLAQNMGTIRGSK